MNERIAALDNGWAIESDGTPHGTRVYDEYGDIVPGIQEITWHVELHKRAEITVRLAPPLVARLEGVPVLDPVRPEPPRDFSEKRRRRWWRRG